MDPVISFHSAFQGSLNNFTKKGYLYSLTAAPLITFQIDHITTSTILTLLNQTPEVIVMVINLSGVCLSSLCASA